MPEETTIRPSPIVTSEAPTPRISGGEVAQPYEMLGRAFQKVGAAAEAIAVPLAQRQAAEDLLQQKVTRNADGSINVTQPSTSPLMFGEAGKAYHDAIAAGTMAQWRNALSQRFAEIHQEYPVDPTGFKNATDSFLSTAANDAPPQIQRAVQSEAAQLQTQHYNAITDRAATIDIESKKNAIMAQIRDDTNTAMGLSRKPDGPYSPEYKQAVARINKGWDDLATNPLFKTTPEQIAIEKKNTTALLHDEAVVAQVDDTFTKKGKAEAQAELERVRQDPNLPETERERLYRHGLTHLQFLTEDAKENIAASRETTGLFVKGILDGNLKLNDPTIGMALKRATEMGDTQAVHEINAAITIRQGTRPIDTLPNAIRSQATGVDVAGNPLTTITTKGGKSVTVNTVGAERFKGFLDDLEAAGAPIGNVGGYNPRHIDLRYTGGRPVWSEHAFGRAIDVNQTGRDIVSPEFRAWYSTHQDQLRQIADKYGIVSGGDFRHPDFGHFELARGTEPAGNTVMASSINGGPGFTYDDVKRNPFLLSTYARSLAADPETRISFVKQAIEGAHKALDLGIAPPPATMATIEQGAAMYPEQLAKAVDELHGHAAAVAASILPKDQREAYEAQVRNLANGQDQHQINIVAAFGEHEKRREDNLREHPLQEGAYRGWGPQPAPIDPTKPETIPAALAQHALLAKRIGGMNAMPPPPLIDKDADMPQLRAALQSQSGAQILTSIAQSLKPDELQMLTGQKDFNAAVTGMARSGDYGKMNAAFSFMDTMQRQNPLQFDVEFKDELASLRLWQSNLGKPPDEAVKEMLQSYDPDEIKAREATNAALNEGLKKVTPAQVVAKFSGGLFGPTAQLPDAPGYPAEALKVDYDEYFRQAWPTSGGKLDVADAVAVEQLQHKYGVSPINGNRVTAFPPEKYYPPIDGSYSWMTQQLDDAVREEVKAMKPEPTFAGGIEPGPFMTETAAQRQYEARRQLVPDKTTEQEIGAHMEPSYNVVFQQPNGQLATMMDGNGRARRFYFDPNSVFVERSMAAIRAQPTVQELQRPLGGGVTP